MRETIQLGSLTLDVHYVDDEGYSEAVPTDIIVRGDADIMEFLSESAYDRIIEELNRVLREKDEDANEEAKRWRQNPELDSEVYAVPKTRRA